VQIVGRVKLLAVLLSHLHPVDLNFVVLSLAVEKVDEKVYGSRDCHQELPCCPLENVLLRNPLFVLLQHLPFTPNIPE